MFMRLNINFVAESIIIENRIHSRIGKGLNNVHILQRCIFKSIDVFMGKYLISSFDSWLKK